MPLTGRYDHRLDPKRRFTIPSEWIERMGKPSRVYVMKSLSGRRCIDVFSQSEFDKKLEPFRNRAITDEAAAGFLSRLGERVESLGIDTQNRIRVKDSLLGYAGITDDDDDLVLIGATFRFEIWSLGNRPKDDGAGADDDFNAEAGRWGL